MGNRSVSNVDEAGGDVKLVFLVQRNPVAGSLRLGFLCRIEMTAYRSTLFALTIILFCRFMVVRVIDQLKKPFIVNGIVFHLKIQLKASLSVQALSLG